MDSSQNKLKEVLNKIKILLSDIDGVLTDGGMFYTKEGNVMKRFNVKDGMAVHLLKNSGIECGILTSDDSPINQARGEKLNMDFISIGVRDKKIKIHEICEQKKINPSSIAFIGDDIGDIEALKIVGFSACPSDAVSEVRSSVDYICKQSGGQGVFREIADLIISSKK